MVTHVLWLLMYCTSVLFQYYTSTGLPARKLEPNVCAVCGNDILDDDDDVSEKSYKLSCDHVYVL